VQARAALALLALTSCSSGDVTPSGLWRGQLDSPGGELPFGLRFVPGGDRPAVIINDTEQAPIDRVEIDGRRVLLAIDVYDAVLEGELSTDGLRIEGEWRKTTPDGHSRLPFTAAAGEMHRFTVRDGGDGSVAGSWTVRFTDDDGEWPARAELRQDGARVTGTFLTATGDFRFLDGDFDGSELRLSTFDGAHAFLFRARLGADGSLSGDFWSRDVYHATWRAQRYDPVRDGEALPDPWNEVTIVSDDGRVDFTFEDLDGQPVSFSDERHRGKPALVVLFGTWCPNCRDLTPLLVTWHRRRDVNLIGLAYEFTGDRERDRRVLRTYRDAHGIDFPLLLAGVSDKAEASETMPALSRIKSYPTTIFIDHEGVVRHIYSGFAGPATGRHHRELVASFERKISDLVAAAAESSAGRARRP